MALIMKGMIFELARALSSSFFREIVASDQTVIDINGYIVNLREFFHPVLPAKSLHDQIYNRQFLIF